MPPEMPSPRISPHLLTGLRVWADEGSSGAEQRALQRVAAGLAVGDVDAILADRKLPPLLRTALNVGLSSGRLLEVMKDYLLISKRNQELLRLVRQRLAYPLTLFLLTLGLLCFIANCLGIILSLAIDSLWSSVLQNSLVMVLLPWISIVGAWSPVLLLLSLAATFVLIWVFRDSCWWIPIYGRVLRNAGLAEFCGTMALMIEGELPIPAALRLVHQTSHSSNVSRASLFMAQAIERGSSVSQASAQVPSVFGILSPVFQLQGHPHALVSALRAYGENLAEICRVDLQQLLTLVEMILLSVVMLIGVAGGFLVYFCTSEVVSAVGM